MELKYIWIEQYKNLNKIGFNFNNSDNTSINFKDNSLIINSKKSNIPPNFFSDVIDNVTGIIGENGTGKTNLSEFLLLSLAHVTNGGLQVFIPEILKGIIVLGMNVFLQEKIIINNEEVLKKKGYKIIRYKQVPLDKERLELMWYEMEYNKYIYYSPIFNFRTLGLKMNLTDISTSYLVKNDLNNSRKHINYSDYNNNNNNNNNNNKTDYLLAHYRNEKIRESDFLINFKNIKSYIDEIPINIILSIDDSNENKLLISKHYLEKDLKDANKSNVKELYNELYELNNLSSFEDKIEEFKIKKKDEDRYSYDLYKLPVDIKKRYFKKVFFIKLFYLILKTNDESKIDLKKGLISKFIYNEPINENSKIITKLHLIKSKLNDLIELSNWNEINQKVDSIEYHDYFEREKQIYNLFRNLEISLDTHTNKVVLAEIISLTKKITNNQLHFHYEFIHGLSSGQQHLLNLYSRFYWAKEQIDISEKEEHGIIGKRVVIFIDEGEVALHPEWQRVFFNKMNNFLSTLFKDKKVQLIFTTHSPFVLSDLPKENVLFLKRNKNGDVTLVDIEKEITFGANIHDLLSNNFFMKSTIGEFAEEKIKKIVDFYYQLKNKEGVNNGNLQEYYKKHQKEFTYTYDNIGDEVVKNIIYNHLQYINKTLLNKTDYNKMRIEELENELKKLKKDE